MDPKSNIDTKASDSILDFEAGDRFSLAGRYAHAYEEYNRLLSSETHDISASDLGTIYQKLGITLFHLARFADALETLNKALQIKQNLEDTALDKGIILRFIGDTYFEQGEYSKSEKSLQDALEMLIKDFGEAHNEVIACYAKVSEVYEIQGKKTEELSYLEKAIQLSSTKKTRNEELAESYMLIGRSLRSKKEYEQSIEALNNAIEIKKEIYGDNHFKLAKCYNELGRSYLYKGEDQEALKHFEQVLKIRLEYLGDLHRSVGDCYNNIGHAYYGLEQSDEALENYLKGLQIYEKCLSENHPDIPATLRDVADVYYQQKKWKKALNYYNKAIDGYSKASNKDQISIAQCYAEIVRIALETRKYPLAENAALQELDIELKILGLNHQKVAITYRKLGLCYYHLDFNKSLGSFLKAFKIYNKLEEKDYSELADCLFNSAEAFEKYFDFPSADKAVKKAFQAYIKAETRDSSECEEAYEELTALEKISYLSDMNQNNIF